MTFKITYQHILSALSREKAKTSQEILETILANEGIPYNPKDPFRPLPPEQLAFQVASGGDALRRLRPASEYTAEQLAARKNITEPEYLLSEKGHEKRQRQTGLDATLRPRKA